MWVGVGIKNQNWVELRIKCFSSMVVYPSDIITIVNANMFCRPFFNFTQQTDWYSIDYSAIVFFFLKTLPVWDFFRHFFYGDLGPAKVHTVCTKVCLYIHLLGWVFNQWPIPNEYIRSFWILCKTFFGHPSWDVLPKAHVHQFLCFYDILLIAFESVTKCNQLCCQPFWHLFPLSPFLN